MAGEGDRGEDTPRNLRNQARCGAEEPEPVENAAREDGGHDLAGRQGGREDPDGETGAPEEKETEVARRDGTEIGIPENFQQDREIECGREHAGQNDEARQVLAQNDRRVRDRRRGQDLPGPEFFLLREQAHGEDRGEEDDEQFRRPEEAPDARFGVTGAGQIAGEEGAGQDEEYGGRDIGDRRSEVGARFLADDEAEIAHCFVPPCSAVSFRKMSSRLMSTCSSARRVHPARTTDSAIPAWGSVSGAYST